MTSAVASEDGIKILLSRHEAIVLFEWLSRNWVKDNMGCDELFNDPAEKQLLIWLDNDLAPLLSEVFDEKYHEVVRLAYREVVPDKEGWV